MNLNIALLAHHDHGIEVMNQVVKCLHAIEENYNHHFSLSFLPSFKRQNSVWLNEDAVLACKKSDAVLSSFSLNKEPYYKNKNGDFVSLTAALDCYSTISPVLPFPKQISVRTGFENKIIDFVIFTALKSGHYQANLSNSSIVSDTYYSNTQGVHQLFHLAFKTAKNRNQNLTVSLPNGPAKLALWEKTLSEISLSYPMIRVRLVSFEELIKQLIKAPENLDCIFADEIQGPVLQSQSKVLFGLQNLLPLAHMGMGINIFEPLSTSFSAIKQGLSNPIALIYSLALMLSRFGLQEEARSIQLAIDKASERGMFTLEKTLTAPFNCNQLGDFIAAAIIDSEDIGVINDENIDLGKSTII